MTNKIFGEEKISKLLLRFSVPIVLYILLSEFYITADTFFAGHSLGRDAIGALTIIYPIQRLAMSLSLLISVGTATTLSRSTGGNDLIRSRKVLENGFTLSYSVMIPFTLVTFIFRKEILTILGAGQDILPLANDYLRYVIFGNIFLCLTIFFSDTTVALGNNRVSMTAAFIGAIVNLILDYLLVMRMGMNISILGLTTTVSQMIGFAYAYYSYKKMTREFGISLRFELDKALILPIILVGMAAFLIEVEDGILMAVLNNLLKDSADGTGIIVLGVVSKVYLFLFMTILALGTSMQPIAAYNVGARDYKRLKEIVRKTSLYTFMVATLLWAISMVFTPQLIRIFVTDSYIIEESIFAFRIVISAFPVVSIYYVSIYYFQAKGKSRVSILLSILRQLIIMIPMSIILVKIFNLGAFGVWISYPISDILSSLVSFILIKNEDIKLNATINEIERNIKGTSSEQWA